MFIVQACDPTFRLFRSISYRFRDKCKFMFFEKISEIFKNVVLWSLTLHGIPNFHLFHSISYHLRDQHFLHKNEKNRGFFPNFKTHDLEVLGPNYEKAHLLRIDNIAAKFEVALDKIVRCPPPQAITITQKPASCGLKMENKKYTPSNQLIPLPGEFLVINII